MLSTWALVLNTMSLGHCKTYKSRKKYVMWGIDQLLFSSGFRRCIYFNRSFRPDFFKNQLSVKFVTQPQQKQLAKFRQILKVKFWRYYSSFATENNFKRFRTLIDSIGQVFLARKSILIEIRKSKLVDFVVKFHKIGKILIQEHIIRKWFWRHTLTFLKLNIMKFNLKSN